MLAILNVALFQIVQWLCCRICTVEERRVLFISAAAPGRKRPFHAPPAEAFGAEAGKGAKTPR